MKVEGNRQEDRGATSFLQRNILVERPPIYFTLIAYFLIAVASLAGGAFSLFFGFSLHGIVNVDNLVVFMERSHWPILLIGLLLIGLFLKPPGFMALKG